MGDIIFYLTAWMEASYQRRDFAQDDMCEFAEWYHQKREQERQGPAPDRDELAMTMPVDHLPQIKGINIFENIGEEIVSRQVDDILADIKSSLEFDARKVEIDKPFNPDPDLQHIQNVRDTCESLGCTPAELLKMNYMSELKK